MQELNKTLKINEPEASPMDIFCYPFIHEVLYKIILLPLKIGHDAFIENYKGNESLLLTSDDEIFLKFFNLEKQRGKVDCNAKSIDYHLSFVVLKEELFFSVLSEAIKQDKLKDLTFENAKIELEKIFNRLVDNSDELKNIKEKILSKLLSIYDVDSNALLDAVLERFSTLCTNSKAKDRMASLFSKISPFLAIANNSFIATKESFRIALMLQAELAFSPFKNLKKEKFLELWIDFAKLSTKVSVLSSLIIYDMYQYAMNHMTSKDSIKIRDKRVLFLIGDFLLPNSWFNTFKHDEGDLNLFKEALNKIISISEQASLTYPFKSLPAICYYKNLERSDKFYNFIKSKITATDIKNFLFFDEKNSDIVFDPTSDKLSKTLELKISFQKRKTGYDDTFGDETILMVAGDALVTNKKAYVLNEKKQVVSTYSIREFFEEVEIAVVNKSALILHLSKPNLYLKFLFNKRFEQDYMYDYDQNDGEMEFDMDDFTNIDGICESQTYLTDDSINSTKDFVESFIPLIRNMASLIDEFDSKHLNEQF